MRRIHGFQIVLEEKRSTVIQSNSAHDDLPASSGEKMLDQAIDKHCVILMI